MTFLIGADVGGTATKIGIFDMGKDAFIQKWEIKTDISENGKNILSDINKSVREVLHENHIQINELKGIGFGVPGPVDKNSIVRKCVNLGWGYVDIVKDFSQMMPINIKAGNDANVAALGECWKGAGRHHDSIAMVTLGTGVGGGIIVDNKIVTGAVGAAGEIGHFHVSNNETETCGCGNKGCLEQYASATGIVREAKKKLFLTDEPTKLREVEHITEKNIFNLAKKGDKVCLQLVTEFADKLGFAVSNIACVTNPDAIVMGGGVAKAGKIIIDLTKEAFLKYAFHAHRDTEIILAELGNDAGIYGAVKLVFGN